MAFRGLRPEVLTSSAGESRSHLVDEYVSIVKEKLKRRVKLEEIIEEESLEETVLHRQ